MPILFIGESGDIQDAVEAQFANGLRGNLITCTFAQVSSPSQIIGADIDMIVVGVEHSDQGELVSRVLKDAAEKRIPAIVFARAPTGTQVLDWLKLGSAAVELWPCQSSRIAFLVEYLTVGRRMNPQPRVEKSASPADDSIVMASGAMQRLVDQINRVAPLDVNVLLSGETGVGKTRLARLLHDRSQRKDSAFFAVNCGALPENLLESELFGHRRGAFTGADAERKGRFDEVGDGTLFLDEVDSIPVSSQCKLLRAIENRVFEPLGSNKSIAFRGRIVAASNSHLEQLIEQGQFRADLYYRLGVMDLYIPPLRERRDDIRPIAEATLREYSARNGLPVRFISREVIELLEIFPWPGNVRQLRNVIESSASLCCGEQIELSDLSGRWVADARKSGALNSTGHSTRVPRNPEFASEASVVGVAKHSLAESRAQLEADRIRSVLHEVGNNRTKAAMQLGISRTMLYKKLAKYGLAKC